MRERLAVSQNVVSCLDINCGYHRRVHHDLG